MCSKSHNLAIYSTQVIDTPPKTYGGLEEIAYLLTRYLEEQGHTIHLFATEDSYQSKNVHLYTVGKAGTNPIEAWKAYWNDTRSREALLQSDIVCDMSWNYYPYSVASQLKNITHVVHGPDPGFKQLPPVDKPNLITVGFQLARYFNEITGLEWRTVHNGIDIDKYPYQDEKENYLLWLSRIYPFKGTHRFIEICNQLEMKGVIAGGSFGDDQNYTNLVKEKCEESKYVDYLGEVSFKKKLELLQNAKALIQPNILRLPIAGKQDEYFYFREPFGLTVLEANAVGTPVVVSPIYGWTETLIHGYNGFHANSDREFIYYIKRIDEILHIHCRHMATLFDYHRMGENYLRLFNEIINGGGW